MPKPEAPDPSRPPDALHLGDGIAGLRTLPAESVHLILSDIPYGIGVEEWDVLHANTNSAYGGNSPAQAKAGAVFAKRGKPINGWSQADRLIPAEYQAWCATWAPEWYRVLKPGGSALIFAGRRYGHRCVCAMEDAGFSLRDILAWNRVRAPHRAQRLSAVLERRGESDAAAEWEGWRIGNLRPTFEPILWLVKPYRIGATVTDNALTHGVGPYNEAAFEKYVSPPANLITCGFEAGEGGLHPTQKPLALMRGLIELTTQPGQLVVDPFAGSGTTLVAARGLWRRYVGWEVCEEYWRVAEGRLVGLE